MFSSSLRRAPLGSRWIRAEPQAQPSPPQGAPLGREQRQPGWELSFHGRVAGASSSPSPPRLPPPDAGAAAVRPEEPSDLEGGGVPHRSALLPARTSGSLRPRGTSGCQWGALRCRTLCQGAARCQQQAGEPPRPRPLRSFPRHLAWEGRGSTGSAGSFLPGTGGCGGRRAAGQAKGTSTGGGEAAPSRTGTGARRGQEEAPGREKEGEELCWAPLRCRLPPAGSTPFRLPNRSQWQGVPSVQDLKPQPHSESFAITADTPDGQ